MKARLSVAVLLLSLAFIKLDIVGLARFVLLLAPASYAFRGGDDVGLVFLPGATTDPAAYAPLLKRVAEEARATVVLGRPACRAPVLFGGAQAFRALAARYPGVRTWAVGGHSMGAGPLGAAGIAADPTSGADGLAMLAGVLTGSVDLFDGPELDSLAVLRGYDPLDVPASWRSDLRKQAVLAGVPMGSVDLSKYPELEGLAVFGSEDTITTLVDGAKAGDATSIRDNCKELPPRTRVVVIRGGNHAGFGLLGPQTFPGDGARTISLEDQQNQTAHHLVSFLRRVARRHRWDTEHRWLLYGGTGGGPAPSAADRAREYAWRMRARLRDAWRAWLLADASSPRPAWRAWLLAGSPQFRPRGL